MSLLLMFLSKHGFAIFVGLFLAWILRYWIRRRQELPGPFCLPFFGYIPLTYSKTLRYVMLRDLSKKYGDVYQIQLGENKTVVLNSSAAFKEMLQMPEFNYRADAYLYTVMKEAGERSLIFESGIRWKLARKISQRAVGLFGSSKNAGLEEKTHQSISWLIQELGKLDGQSGLTKPLLMQCTGASISSMVFGSDPNPEDEYLTKLYDILGKVFIGFGTLLIPENFPSLAPLFSTFRQRMFHAYRDYVGYLENAMYQYSRGEEIRTIGDSLVKAAEEFPDKQRQESNLSNQDIKAIGIDLFDAGFFTMSEMLEWLLILMSCNPEIQSRVHSEIDQFVSKGQLPSLQTDYQNLSFTKACIMEALRWTSNKPLGLTHMTSVDVVFRGHIIRKGTHILPNLWAVNHDPVTFKDPDKFDPDRFLEKDGSFNQVLAEEVVAFGYGKRRCPGESIAKQELFLIFAAVMQGFVVSQPTVPLNYDPLEGAFTYIAYNPPSHELIIRKR